MDPQGHKTTFSHRIWQQVFHFFLQFSWTTAKGKLCDGTNTADGRNGTNWKREGASERDCPHWTSLSSPFLRFTHAARWRRRRRRRHRRAGAGSSRENEINCLALSTALLCVPSLSLSCCSIESRVSFVQKLRIFSETFLFLALAVVGSSLSSNPQFTPQQPRTSERASER